MENTLFVYGSFVEGEVHYNRILPFIEAQKAAVARGSVFKLEVGYPVFLDDNEFEIPGHLVTLRTSDILFSILDEFHGYKPQVPEKSLFLRKSIVVETGEGPITTFAYAVNPLKLPKTAKRLASGDWQKDLQDAKPVTLGLTENQRRYVLKLGASSGRDIVPINLELYRELMNKGLIVDKGRRLALTNLGKEVYRYLE